MTAPQKRMSFKQLVTRPGSQNILRFSTASLSTTVQTSPSQLGLASPIVTIREAYPDKKGIGLTTQSTIEKSKYSTIEKRTFGQQHSSEQAYLLTPQFSSGIANDTQDDVILSDGAKHNEFKKQFGEEKIRVYKSSGLVSQDELFEQIFGDGEASEEDSDLTSIWDQNEENKENIDYIQDEEAFQTASEPQQSDAGSALSNCSTSLPHPSEIGSEWDTLEWDEQPLQ